MSEKVLCIYHGNCADGFGAAWAVRKALGEGVEFHAGVYQGDPPDAKDRDVILVDFSYKRDVLVGLAERARTVLVVDHHKSAIEDLAEFRRFYPVGDAYEPGMILYTTQQNGGWPIETYFDADRSGAGLAWDFFHPHAPRPKLIDHIEDRDLWRFKLPGTREIQACLFSHPYDFDLWERLMASDLEQMRREGEAIERKHFKDIAELLGVGVQRMVIGGFDVPVANLPYIHSSDAGNKLAQGEPFGACYWDNALGRNFSLRSTDAGEDVSEVAKKYGGGGHRNASGFRVAHGWNGDSR